MTISSALYTTATTLAKVGVGALHIGYVGLCSPIGRVALFITGSLGSAHFYRKQIESSKDHEWSQKNFTPELLFAAGLFTSFSIFRPWFLKNWLASVDATFGGLPYKAMSLCSSGLSSVAGYAYSMAHAKAIDYMANPIKIVDLGVWSLADKIVASMAKDYIADFQRQQEIYGYGDELKDWNQNHLSWLEKFNLGLESIDLNKLLHLNILPGFISSLSASSIRYGYNWIEYMRMPVAYLMSATYMIGLTPIASGLQFIGSTAFTTTALSLGSIALNTASIGVSIVSVARMNDYFFIYNQKYDEIIQAQKNAAKDIEAKIKYAHTFAPKPQEPEKQRGLLFFTDYYSKNPKVKEVMLEFSKFKDKRKSDYIYAFAIKLLDAEVQNPQYVKLLMMSVIMEKENFNNFISHIHDIKTSIFTGKEDFTQHALSLDHYITQALANLLPDKGNIQTFDIRSSEERINIPNNNFEITDPNIRNNIPDNISEGEKGYLSNIDLISFDRDKDFGKRLAAAVQEFLHKVNSIEKQAPGMMGMAKNFIVGSR
jgi:hypothetical protein